MTDHTKPMDPPDEKSSDEPNGIPGPVQFNGPETEEPPFHRCIHCIDVRLPIHPSAPVHTAMSNHFSEHHRGEFDSDRYVEHWELITELQGASDDD